MTGYRLSERAAKATAKVVESVLRDINGTPRGGTIARPAGQTRYIGVLLGDLAPPGIGTTDATTALMQVWTPDPESNFNPVHMIDDEDLILTVVNRDHSLSGVEGAFIKVEFLHGEWSPYWVGCP